MGGKKGKKTTVGYRYYMDIHAGLGRGEVDEIIEIRVDKKTAWAGEPNELSYSRAIYIDKPNLFGGEDTGGEGGIQGRIEILMGSDDQKPSGMLQNLINSTLNPNNKEWMSNPVITATQAISGRLIPGFRGLVTTVFSGLISCYSAYPKPWAYRVRRTAKGWSNNAIWYPAKINIVLKNDNATITGVNAKQEQNLRTIYAMNPAHILIECATNTEWGNGKRISLSDIDIASYTAAADTLYSEGFGLCFRYNRQDSLNSFVSQVINHIGAAQYVDLETGKLTLRLIRNDYNPDSLPVFTYDNGILSVQDDDSASSDVAANEVVVNYHDPVMNEPGSVRAQNLASIQSHGVISKSTDYLAIPTFDLASRVALRDLEAGTSGLTRLKIRFDRRAGHLAPVSVFRINLPDREINNMVMRVGQVQEQDDGSLLITAIQDVFGLPATNYGTIQPPSGWTPPDRTAVPVKNSIITEIPYFVLAGSLSPADLDYLPATAGYISICAQSPSSLSINYLLQTRPAGGQYQDVLTGDWSNNAMLLADITYTDTVFKLSLNGDYSAFKPGVPALINNEVVVIVGVDFTSGNVTVGRGCADSIPVDHVGGSLFWLLDDAESDNIQYAVGETVNARMLTNTMTDQLNPDLAPQIAATMQQRQYRPYPPGNVRVNGVQTRTVDDRSSFVLSWSHRDRVLQADNLFEHNEGDISLEPGAFYMIKLYKGSALVRAINVATDNTFSYPDRVNETTQEPILEDFDRITLYSQRDEITSLQSYVLRVLV